MKKLRKPLLALEILVVAVIALFGCLFLWQSADPPVLYINGTAVARTGPLNWNWSHYSLVPSGLLEYGPENTVYIAAGDTLALRAKKAQWWAPRWKIIQGSGSAVFTDEFGSLSAQWAGSDILPVPVAWESIVELWVSYNGWLRPVFGNNRVRYSFIVKVATCQH